jgi:hypothetical protein
MREATLERASHLRMVAHERARTQREVEKVELPGALPSPARTRRRRATARRGPRREVGAGGGDERLESQVQGVALRQDRRLVELAVAPAEAGVVQCRSRAKEVNVDSRPS